MTTKEEFYQQSLYLENKIGLIFAKFSRQNREIGPHIKMHKIFWILPLSVNFLSNWTINSANNLSLSGESNAKV